MTPAHQRPTVFVVDDDKAMQQVLGKVLAIYGISTREFSSAKEFLSSYNPDWTGCVLVDVLMPDMDGFELMTILRKINTKLHAILMTGNANELELQNLLGAQDAIGTTILKKPFRLEELLGLIRPHFTEIF